jgi:hypothetical protein
MMPEFITAVSRLNSWARSEGARRNFHSPVRAIYYLKREAIQWAHENLSCLHSTVKITVVCRACGGTGNYVDSYGYEWDHCRACNSRGRVALLFVQTAIGGGPIWHTPWMKFFVRCGGPHPPYNLARWVDDWTVNEPGLEMEPWEVARDLNLVETTFTRRPGWYSTDYGTFNDFGYTLYLGDTERECGFCGSREGLLAHHVIRRPVCWTAFACAACSKLPKVFDQFAIPLTLVHNPHILKFKERRTYENALSPRPNYAEV